MPRRPACTGARAWTAWAPTAACARRATGAPAASWTWTSARASRVRTGASATTWLTGERTEAWAAAAGKRRGAGRRWRQVGRRPRSAQPGPRSPLQLPVRLRGHGLRGRALRAGGAGVRVGSLRQQRVLPRGPRDLPLPLLARCVRAHAAVPGRGAQPPCVRAPLPSEGVQVTAASLNLRFAVICQLGLITAPAPSIVARQGRV